MSARQFATLLEHVAEQLESESKPPVARAGMPAAPVQSAARKKPRSGG